MPNSSPALVVPMRRNAIITLIAFLLAPAVAAVVGLVSGSAAGYGVLLGLWLPITFFGITVLTALLTARASVTQLGVAVLLSWLLKIAALIVVLAWLQGQDFFSRPVFFGVFLGSIVAVLISEAVIVKNAKVPFVDV